MITMSRLACRFLLLLPLVTALTPVPASTPEARAHIQANIEAEAAKDEKTSVRITLSNAQGKVQERTLHWTTITLPSGDKRSLVVFDLPKAIRGTGLLTHENTTSDDERWLYLPALKKTRRISGSDKSDTFMGTDFAYEDLVTEEPEKYDYTFPAIQDCGPTCVKVIAVPATEQEKRESGYARREITLDTRTHMVLAVEYFNKAGIHAKSYKASEFQTVHPNGALRPFRMEMVDLLNQHTTVMLFEGYHIDTGVSESDVSQRALTQGR